MPTKRRLSISACLVILATITGVTALGQEKPAIKLVVAQCAHPDASGACDAYNITVVFTKAFGDNAGVRSA
ncbi:MAG: hypothetical protein ACREAC_08920, partial [Blastocatellia bacterium]